MKTIVLLSDDTYSEFIELLSVPDDLNLRETLDHLYNFYFTKYVQSDLVLQQLNNELKSNFSYHFDAFIEKLVREHGCQRIKHEIEYL